jgi:hypothetical protein
MPGRTIAAGVAAGVALLWFSSNLTFRLAMAGMQAAERRRAK